MEHQHRTSLCASGIDHKVDVWPISAGAEAEMLHWQSVTPAEASGLPSHIFSKSEHNANLLISHRRCKECPSSCPVCTGRVVSTSEMKHVASHAMVERLNPPNSVRARTQLSAYPRPQKDQPNLAALPTSRESTKYSQSRRIYVSYLPPWQLHHLRPSPWTVAPSLALVSRSPSCQQLNSWREFPFLPRS